LNARLLLAALEREPDVVLVRKRTRRVAELLGFDRQDQTHITTAVSELARNAFEYAGGGRAEFRIKDDASPPDVALLDLRMPEMTGFVLFDRISDETSLDGVPAIVLTSAILTLDERQRLRRAARIMSKSDLSGSASPAPSPTLSKSPSEAA
jgi:CheY-like chemotaxis protein